MATKVAVVGAGIAGLSAAYHLCPEADVVLYDADDRVGGHANTVEVVDGDRVIGLDTAFIVYNEPHYPRLAEFFRTLDVPTLDHEGGFLFFDVSRRRHFTSEDLELPESAVLAEHDAEFHGIWREAARFEREAPRDFIRGRARMPLGDYLDSCGYSAEFRRNFLVLVATAAWSIPPREVWRMSASTVMAFFMAHGLAGLSGRRVAWRTVLGGSVSYLWKVGEHLRSHGTELRLGEPVVGVREMGDRATVTTAGGTREFDYVVVATHADTTKELLGGVQRKHDFLDSIRYTPTRAVLHTDSSVLTPPKQCWRSWNYARVGDGDDFSTYATYYLNRLHRLDSEKDYFLTLEPPASLRDEEIIKDIGYRHPVLEQHVRDLQPMIYKVNDSGRIKLCGSYFHSRKMGFDIVGLHESAYDSGLAAAECVRREVRREFTTAGVNSGS
ncbi:NAD(P)/FAD-dependent oxidoreductase [Kutzneria sp. CA-103260]|uniref:NAD(P)/FAD-dependent oxidoreductase n=1 Tax=Kutzneria sp. CA-103260 TaxID=2802641 RepID=UPI001BA5491C|nr:FAD-dependent oxidoreductase [Kutzneria sp. CA-103260]QUQ72484.1 amine oxidase [Kutzneria sp. CA-103260]